MFTCSPQDKIIVEFIKMTPFKSLQVHQKKKNLLQKVKLSYILDYIMALNAWFLLLEHQWAFESSLIVASPSVVLGVKRWISKSLSLLESHCWKGFKLTKMLENQSISGTWRIFLKNSRQFNCSGQTRDSWTTITKKIKNSAVDHSGNNTVLRIKRM